MTKFLFWKLNFVSFDVIFLFYFTTRDTNFHHDYLLQRTSVAPAAMTMTKATPRPVRAQPIVANAKSDKSDETAKPEINKNEFIKTMLPDCIRETIEIHLSLFDHST